MRTCLAIFAYVIFILLVVPILALFNLQHTLATSPDSLKQDLRKINAYSRIVSLNASDIAKLLNPENRDPESQISEAQISTILKSVPPETLQKISEQSMDAVFDGIKNNRATADIDTKEIKALVLKSQPPEITEQLNQALPNTYQIQLPKQNGGWWKLARNKAANYIGLSILVLFALIIVLSSQGGKSKMRSLSAILLITTIAIAIMYLTTKLLPIALIDKLSDNSASQQLLSILKDFAEQIRTRLLILETKEMIYVGVACLVFFGISFAFKPIRSNAPVPPVATPAPTPPIKPGA